MWFKLAFLNNITDSTDGEITKLYRVLNYEKTKRKIKTQPRK